MKLYDDLGVPVNATKKEIKQAFKKLSSIHHPDKGGDNKKFQIIQNSYMILSNPEKRDYYDKTGDVGSNRRTPGKVLLDAFAAIIQNMSFEGNIINNITQSLAEKIAQVKTENLKLDFKEKELKKQRGRITTKHENFFELILTENIQHLVNKRVLNQKAIAEFEELIQMVSDYSDERPEEQIHFIPSTSNIGATTGFNQG